MTQVKTNTDSLTIDILRQLAFMQSEGTDFFIEDGKAYEGNKKELWDEWVKYTENLPDAQTWEEFRDENCPEVEEFDNDDYLVLTDEEADEKAKEYITESLWAFTPSFLASMTDFDEEIFQAIADNGKCESNNDTIYNTIQKTCGIDDFVEAAISADGRGHFMSSYDGCENEETVNIPSGEFEGQNTFYIYRLN